MNLRLFTPFEKEGVAPRCVCDKWLSFSHFVCLGRLASAVFQQETPPVHPQPHRIKCASAYMEKNLETQNTPNSSIIIIFNVFYKSQVMPCIEYAFGGGGGGIEIALHVRHGVITCLYENSE